MASQTAPTRCPTCGADLTGVVQIRRWSHAEPAREVPRFGCCPATWPTPPPLPDEKSERPKRGRWWNPGRKMNAAAAAFCAVLTAAALGFFAIGAWGAGAAFTALALVWATFIATD